MAAQSVYVTGRDSGGTGLYYYRARYYDPIRSRFVSEDPLGLAGGINRFAYVAGNPVGFVDPTGHFLATAIGGMAVGAGVGTVSAVLGGGDVVAGAISGMLSGGLTGTLVGLGVPFPAAAGVGSLVTQAVTESLNGTIGADTAALRIALAGAIGAGVGTLGSQILPGAGLPGRIVVSGTTGLNKTAANGVLSDIDLVKAWLMGRTKSINEAISCP